jgi:tetratricopeptide (TPR) repeat protein
MHAEQIRASSANAHVKLAAARMLVGEHDSAQEILKRVERTPKASDAASLLLIAWVREAISPGEEAQAARERFVTMLGKKTDTFPLQMPSLAADALLRAQDEQADPSTGMLWLARTLDHLGDVHGAITYYGRAIEAKPGIREVLLERGRLYLRLSEWKKAVSDFQEAIELKPDDHYLWFTTSSLILWAGDEAGYRKHSEAMLKRFSNATEAYLAERTAKACALLNTTPEVSKQLMALSERAVTRQADSPFYGWFLYSHALTNYRAGNMEATIEQARLALKANATLRTQYISAGARLLQALAHHKLGHANEARSLLAEAEEIIYRNLPDIDQTHPDANFHDLLTCLILQREARNAITPNALPRAPSPREVYSIER